MIEATARMTMIYEDHDEDARDDDDRNCDGGDGVTRVVTIVGIISAMMFQGRRSAAVAACYRPKLLYTRNRIALGGGPGRLR